jgi:hypothetical protein
MGCNEEHEDKLDLARIDLKGWILDLRCAEDGDVKAYLEALTRMVEEHATMGGIIEDEEQVEITIRSLPRSYRTIFAAMMAVGRCTKKPIKVDDIVKEVKEEYAARKLDNQDTKRNQEVKKEENDALYTQGGGSGSRGTVEVTADIIEEADEVKVQAQARVLDALTVCQMMQTSTS